jgi:hypothetical protein
MGLRPGPDLAILSMRVNTLVRGMLDQLNLIRFFDFYLALVFLASILLRVKQYREVGALFRAMPGRWPKLMQLIGRHKSLFLTRATVGPALLAFALIVIQMLASRLLWPEAGEPEHGLTIARLLDHWVALIIVATIGATMVGVDIYATVVVTDVNRPEMEKYFDQAEFWLRSWTAPVVRAFTFGWINPRKMVTGEVRKALEVATSYLNTAIWWVVVQTGLRVSFGLALWITYAATRD